MFAVTKFLMVMTFGSALAVSAQEKITYQDHILPILRNRCLKCHNPDKTKADLNLASYSNALKGSGNGSVLEGGDPDASKLFLCVTHAEEPSMPPKDKLADAEIEMIRQWITGGLLETSGSRAVISSKPKINLAVSASALEKPEGPPPMPVEVFALDPYVRTERSSLTTALAASPWAPLIAIGGQHQVLLYNTDSLALAGIIPFTNGYPADVRFSANGKLLIIGGGRGANLGVSTVWDITEGRSLVTVGEDYDTVLATDISPDQRFIAHGGPDRLVKIFSTASGNLVHKIKKHTEWVTAVRFSQDGRYVATGDRNGGLQVWETEPGAQICTLNGHDQWITGIEWASSNLLVTASEDRTVRIWNTDEAREIKKWNAHDGGVLNLARMRDGHFLTTGRDGKATLWDANGKRTRDFKFPGDIPSRAVPSQDGQRIIGTDWVGLTYVWDAAEGKELGRLSLNPPSVEDQLALARTQQSDQEKQYESAQAKLIQLGQDREGARKKMTELESAAATRQKEAEVARSRHDQLVAGPVQVAQSALTSAQEAFAQALAQRQAAEQALAAVEDEMKAAQQSMDAANQTALAADADAEAIAKDPAKSDEERTQAIALAKTRRDEVEQARAARDRLDAEKLKPAEGDLNAISSRVTEAETRKSEAEAKWASAQAELKSAEETLKAAEIEAAKSQEALQTAQNGDLNKSIQDLDKSTQEHQAKVRELEQAVLAARSHTRDREMQLAYSAYFKAWAPIRPWQDQRAALQASIAELEQSLPRLEAQLTAGEATDLETLRLKKEADLQSKKDTLAGAQRQLAGYQGLGAVNQGFWDTENQRFQEATKIWEADQAELEKTRNEQSRLQTLIADKTQAESEIQTTLKTRIADELKAAQALVGSFDQLEKAAQVAVADAQKLGEIYQTEVSRAEQALQKYSDDKADPEVIKAAETSLQELVAEKQKPAQETLAMAQVALQEQNKAGQTAQKLQATAQAEADRARQFIATLQMEGKAAQAELQTVQAQLNEIVAREAASRRRWEETQAAWSIREAGREMADENVQRIEAHVTELAEAVALAESDLQTFASRHQEKLARLRSQRVDQTALLQTQRQELDALQKTIAPQESEVVRLREVYDRLKAITQVSSL